jgi:hypothetical protein
MGLQQIVVTIYNGNKYFHNTIMFQKDPSHIKIAKGLESS